MKDQSCPKSRKIKAFEKKCAMSQPYSLHIDCTHTHTHTHTALMNSTRAAWVKCLEVWTNYSINQKHFFVTKSVFAGLVINLLLVIVHGNYHSIYIINTYIIFIL